MIIPINFYYGQICVLFFCFSLSLSLSITFRLNVIIHSFWGMLPPSHRGVSDWCPCACWLSSSGQFPPYCFHWSDSHAAWTGSHHFTSAMHGICLCLSNLSAFDRQTLKRCIYLLAIPHTCPSRCHWVQSRWGASGVSDDTAAMVEAVATICVEWWLPKCK